jgi:hypothetical protein
MPEDPLDSVLAELAEGLLAGADWTAWQQAHPQEAQAVEQAQAIRVALSRLYATSVPLPADFEARVLAAVQADTTLLRLLDLGVAGVGQTLVELIGLLLSLLPAVPQPAPAT